MQPPSERAVAAPGNTPLAQARTGGPSGSPEDGASGRRFDGETDHLRIWRSEDFREQALHWIAVQLAGGHTPVPVHGPLSLHRVRFWSAVFTVETGRGRLWFKAANPGQAFEAALLQELARLVPGHVISPLAVDTVRGWLLLPDGGTVLAGEGESTAAQWRGLLEQAARMQADLAPHGEELQLAGLPVLRADQAEHYAAGMIEDLAMLPASHPQHLSAAQACLLEAGLSSAAGAFRALDESGIPHSLQPNDVTLRNAFRARNGAGLRLFDFGDAFWSHPFAALQLPLRMAAGSWPDPAPPDDAVVQRMRRSYLSQWPAVEGDIRRVLEGADRLASLHRCESWRRLLACTHPEALGTRTPRLADWLADALRPASQS
ncbi:hypothetical protein [Arthrobacter sp. YD2]|uniref:hypothetical protein n=1 Tax=Arthrobacter sp. YD2 TaxID=3058046 RepID=UPI0025B4B698|nr:hypothetical protein [Arthrobacter sp. YD2]MDN3905740.1 hypothetical protein [Arthrobacter sp. YD2]